MPRNPDRLARPARTPRAIGTLAMLAEAARFWLPFAIVVVTVWLTVPVGGPP